MRITRTADAGIRGLARYVRDGRVTIAVAAVVLLAWALILSGLAGVTVMPRVTSVYAQPTGTPVVCSASVTISGNTAATAQLVALTAGQRVYVCAFVVTGGGATTAKFVRGTGTDCATGQADLTAALELGDNTSVAVGSGVGWLFRGNAGDALCWTNGAAIQVSGFATYTKF